MKWTDYRRRYIDLRDRAHAKRIQAEEEIRSMGWPLQEREGERRYAIPGSRRYLLLSILVSSGTVSLSLMSVDGTYHVWTNATFEEFLAGAELRKIADAWLRGDVEDLPASSYQGASR